MAEMREIIPTTVFCRVCGHHTPHLEHPYPFKKENWEAPQFSQIIYCKICGTSILEVFTQFPDEGKTWKLLERHPDFRESHRIPIENKGGAIAEELYSNYSDCVKSSNQQMHKASFIYLVAAVDLLSDIFLEKLKKDDTSKKSLKQKLNLLKRNRKRDKQAGKFSSFFSGILEGHDKCTEPSFSPIISDLDDGIKALTGILASLILDKMNEAAQSDLNEIYQTKPQVETSKRR